jgi:hypothetical protein
VARLPEHEAGSIGKEEDGDSGNATEMAAEMGHSIAPDVAEEKNRDMEKLFSYTTIGGGTSEEGEGGATAANVGLSIAPEVFQERMNNVFNEMEMVCSYLDDLALVDRDPFDGCKGLMDEVYR